MCIDMYRNRVFSRDSGFAPISGFGEIISIFFCKHDSNLFWRTIVYYRPHGACALSCIYNQNIVKRKKEDQNALLYLEFKISRTESKSDSRVPRYSILAYVCVILNFMVEKIS